MFESLLTRILKIFSAYEVIFIGKSVFMLSLIIFFMFTSLIFSSSISAYVIPNYFYKFCYSVKSIEKFLMLTSVSLCCRLNPICYEGSKTSLIPINIVFNKSNFILFYRSSDSCSSNPLSYIITHFTNSRLSRYSSKDFSNFSLNDRIMIS